MPNAASPQLRPPVSDQDHVLGPPDAPLTLVEYGDYQCPHCGRAHPIVARARERYGPRLRFVFRNFPLMKMHPRAKLAAEAAEAAGAQGGEPKFWEMHHLLFAHQQELEPEHLQRYAQQIGLDLDRFGRDMNEHAFADRVREDLAGGIRSGVNGTPTFFINGLRHNGGYDFESLVAALDAAVAAAAG